ncbi:protein PET100 homolog, mitochondrial isoform X4 [Narcine bancroftii]|uniref:protein PET100 homolog, mitochondrial isoform X4 n=1 Tax=Narcine bancroftii TaxID=1343680 RepID=UPI003831A4C7
MLSNVPGLIHRRENFLKTFSHYSELVLLDVPLSVISCDSLLGLKSSRLLRGICNQKKERNLPTGREDASGYTCWT